MSLFDNLSLGFAVAFRFEHLLLLVAGCLVGTLAAAKPRFGTLAAGAMLLPVCDKLGLMPAMVLLVGIYCGAYGGVLDALIVARASPDGAPEPVDSAAGPALDRPPFTASPLLVLIAALLGTAAIAVFAPLLIELAFHFGPAEYFSLMVFGLTASMVLASGSLLKAVSMLVFGLLLSQISTDPASGAGRFTFDLAELKPGIGFIPLAIGIVTLGRIVSELEPRFPMPPHSATEGPPHARFNARKQWPQFLRGSAIGALFGALPGGGARLAAFISLAAERQFGQPVSAADHDPIRVTAPSAALVTGGRSSFIALLALGFPVNASLALMAAVMLAKQIEVGPQMMTSKPELFWGLIAATGLCALLLFVAARPLMALSRHLRSSSAKMIYPVLVIFCCIGVHALRNSVFDVFMMALFVFVGYAFFKLGCQLAPLILGFILGPMMESNLRHALELSDGSWSVLLVRPISGGLLLAAALLLAAITLPSLRKRRAVVFRKSE